MTDKPPELRPPRAENYARRVTCLSEDKGHRLAWAGGPTAMSPVCRVVRQFLEGVECIMLEHVVVLPQVPTMGTWLDLGTRGVEEAWRLWP